MPVLKNARHELFAQSVASGKELQEAYAAAGFSPNRGHASTLNQNEAVRNRIDHLLKKRADNVLKKTAREAEVTRDTLLAKLDKAFRIAEKARNGSAMTMSVIGMARICGLIIDRREVGDVGSFSSMTDEELVRDIAERSKRLGIARLVANNDELANDEKEAG